MGRSYTVTFPCRVAGISAPSASTRREKAATGALAAPVHPSDARDGSIGRQSASGQIAARRRRRTTADTRSTARGPLQSWHAHGGIAVSIHPTFAPTHDKGAGRSNPVAQHHSLPAAHRAPVTGSATRPRDGAHRRAAAREPIAELELRRGSPPGSKAAWWEAFGPRSVLARWPGETEELHRRYDEQHGGNSDQAVACCTGREVAGDPDQEEHGSQEDREAHVLVCRPRC
jgi:hypothetical protein